MIGDGTIWCIGSGKKVSILNQPLDKMTVFITKESQALQNNTFDSLMSVNNRTWDRNATNDRILNVQLNSLQEEDRLN